MDATPIAERVQKMSGDAFCDVTKGGPGKSCVQKMLEIGAGRDTHAEWRDLGQRRLEIPEAVAQFPAVERRGANRASADHRAGRMAVKIRNRIAVDEGEF